MFWLYVGVGIVVFVGALWLFERGKKHRIDMRNPETQKLRGRVQSYRRQGPPDIGGPGGGF